jgi:hypothetical protein
VFEVKKDLQDVSAGMGIFKNEVHNKFSPQFNVKICEVNFDLAWYN